MLAGGALLCATAAYAEDFSILYHERPGEWSVGPDTTSKSSAVQSQKPAADDSILSFTAFGRQFRARLESNDLLLSGLSQEALSSLRDTEVFGGELVDLPRSWVRLTRSGRDITGVIFDGTDLFAIDSAARLAPHLKVPEPSPYTGPIVYRWRDTTGTLIDELGGRVAAASTESPMTLAATAAVLDPGRRVDLGVVADAEFSARAGSDAAGAVLSRVNILDGILVFELGLHVNLAELAVFSQEADPFTSAEPSALLAELGEYRATTPTQAAQDLTHLLTGRDLSTSVVGLANLASVCDARRGVSLTESVLSNAFRDALIMAHELGHNFGAPHDGAPGPCLSTPLDYIMAPQFNSSQKYSQCSIDQMQPGLTSACIDVLAPGDVELRTVSVPADAMIGEVFSVFVSIDNPSPADAYGVELRTEGTNLTFANLSTGTPGVSCLIEAGSTTARCRKTVLPRGESLQIQISARMSSAMPTTLSVAVRSLSDPDTTDNAATYTLAVRPFVDLAAAFAPAPEYVRVGQQADYAATVRNNGSMTATNARAVVGFSWPVLSVVNLSTGVGACATYDSGHYLCPLGNLAAGETRPISLRLRAIDAISTSLPGHYAPGGVSIDAAADQPNYGGANSISRSIVVVAFVVDLQTTATPTQQVVVNTPVEFTHTVVNAGPDIATDVVLLLNPGGGEQGVTDAAITSNIGTCQVVNQSAMRFDCRVPTLAVGEALVATVRGTASRLGLFSSANRAEANAYDPSNANNSSGGGYTVVTASVAPPPTPPTSPPPPAASGGGGGATDPIWLALLALMLARPRRPRLARQEAA